MTKVTPELFTTMKRFLSLLAFCTLVTGASAQVQQKVDELIPKLADENVPARYAAQMDLQAIASNSSRPGAEAERSAIGKVLAAKVADDSIQQPARVWMVRQLEYMGGAEAVPALTKLLTNADAELRECARRALEKNSAPEASASLRTALQSATDAAWKNGLINSLGQRGDATALPLVIASLNDPQVAGAAALALGKIPDARAIDALWTALKNNTPNAADALVVAAYRMEADTTKSIEIFQRLYTEKAVSTRAAALTGLIKVNPAGAGKLIEAVLTGNETKLQQAAISAVARSTDKGLSQVLVAMLPRLGAPGKAQIITILDTPAAESQVITCVADTDETVRRAAIEALGRLGTAASVPVLLKSATEEGKPGKSTSEAALAKISGTGALAALQQAAGQGEPKTRVAALNALAARKDTTALPAMLGYAAENDSVVRKAALNGLRTMGADAEVEPLAKLALKTESPDASAALEAVAGRVTDKSAAAKKLLALAPGEQQAIALVDALAAVGGNEALALVVKLSSNSNAETQDSAIRALANWPDYAAVAKLLEIAANAEAKPTRHNQALQGVVRLVKTSETESAQARMDAALAAMTATRSDDEKKLVLSALATVPHTRAADTLRPLLTSATLKAEAGFAAVSVAELLVKSDKDAAQALARDVKAANLSREVTRRADSVLRK